MNKINSFFNILRDELIGKLVSIREYNCSREHAYIFNEKNEIIGYSNSQEYLKYQGIVKDVLLNNDNYLLNIIFQRDEHHIYPKDEGYSEDIYSLPLDYPFQMIDDSLEKRGHRVSTPSELKNPSSELDLPELSNIPIKNQTK